MNILFIGGQGRTSDANGVCIRNMVKEMVARGHVVWVLAMGNSYSVVETEQDGASITEVPMSLFWRLSKRNENSGNIFFHLLFRGLVFFRHLLLLFVYPHTAPFRSLRVARIAKKLVKDNEIELVVTTFCPYENIYAGLQLKKKYGDGVRVVSYHLDLRTGSQNSSRLVREYIYKHSLKSLKKESIAVDLLMIPYPGQKEIESIKTIPSGKVKYVGFPVFIDDNCVKPYDLPFDFKEINICYVGTLYMGNRDPRYILSLIEQVVQEVDMKIKVHFWGDMREFESILSDSPIAIYHGMIDNSFVRFIMDNSDFLLNVGNAITYDLLPSKVFGMFATGKPIINVIAHPKDATLPYFARYNYSVDVKEYEKSPEDKEKLKDFIVANKRASRRVSVGLFDDFTPKKICDIILD